MSGFCINCTHNNFDVFEEVMFEVVTNRNIDLGSLHDALDEAVLSKKKQGIYGVFFALMKPKIS